MSSIQAFVSVYDEFVKELVTSFPENEKIAKLKVKFDILKEDDPKKLLDSFVEKVGKYAEDIPQKKSNNLIKITIPIGENETFSAKNFWKSCTRDTKTAIWSYLNTLQLLATTISNIPPELLKSIEGIAEQCASQMEAKGEDLNENNMPDLGTLMAGMQNMLSGLGKK